MRRAMLLLLVAVSAACAGGTPPCRDDAPARVSVLLLNDVYRLEPGPDGRGGLARAATVVRRLRAETPASLVVLAGDTLSPSVLSGVFRGRQMIEAWNALGLDAATFGNHEFDFGPAVLRARMGESRFAWLSANVRAGGRPFGGAVTMLRRRLGAARVGMIGLTLPGAAYTSSAGPEVEFAAPIAAARAAFARESGLDLRLALTHLELDQDRELARAVPLDAILGGHDHEPLIEVEGTTPIVKAGADAVNVGEVRFEMGCDGRVLGRAPRLVPVDAAVEAAPDLAALVDGWAARADAALAAPLATLPRPVDAREAGLRRAPTALGRFLAEAMRARVGAEVGLLNAGAIRANRVIPAGPLTGRDVQALLPFGNVIVLLEVPGRGLAAVLERSVASLPRASGGYLQTAGLDYAVDPGRPPGGRVSAIRVGGRALDPDRAYRVAVPDYLARGGDGYGDLVQARVLRSAQDGPGLFATVVEALRAGGSP